MTSEKVEITRLREVYYALGVGLAQLEGQTGPPDTLIARDISDTRVNIETELKELVWKDWFDTNLEGK